MDEIKRPNGLSLHTPDVPYYWGRGYGGLALYMADLLTYLPKDRKDFTPYHERLPYDDGTVEIISDSIRHVESTN